MLQFHVSKVFIGSFSGPYTWAQYLSPDWADIQFTVTEFCRKMSVPRDVDWASMKKLARHLRGKPKLFQKFQAQSEVDELTI